jgi:sugar lactone lactonase YvrE
MAVTPDNSALLVAESNGRKLTAFDIPTDGSTSNQRVWAELNGRVHDGICLDAEGARLVRGSPHQALRARAPRRSGA